jgi:DNA (cytosine-5)-methyltransferase 1
VTRGKTKKKNGKAGDRARTRNKRQPKIVAVDLFCGVGGLTKGLAKAGIDVKLGVDVDPACEYPFTANNDSEFLLKSVVRLKPKDIAVEDDGALKLLAGCAPCQPFSSYWQKADTSDRRWNLLTHFARLVEKTEPDLVTMENVPNLTKQKVFQRFVNRLKRQDFHVTYEIVDCSEFGVPQQRQRLVLLASKLGPIELMRGTRRKPRTVKQAIGKLPPLKAGQVDRKDPLHQASELSALNLKRIRASKPGGSWREWDERLVAPCHKRATGKTYPGVYGRMTWNEPAPTITTQYFGFGNGRFGHPTQDRAISIREGAILQSFPKGYKFVEPGEPVYRKTIGRLVGNAVPVKLAEAIGKTLVAHSAQYAGTRPTARPAKA